MTIDEAIANYQGISNYIQRYHVPDEEVQLQITNAKCIEWFTEVAEWLKELKEAKELLKLTIDTNYSLHKSCCNCSHFTSDRNCDIGKYLYGTGEKECEWEWKHMGEIIKFLHD